MAGTTLSSIRRRFEPDGASDELLEWATVFDNCYGTQEGFPVEAALAGGHRMCCSTSTGRGRSS